jgi:hypothetical protein
MGRLQRLTSQHVTAVVQVKRWTDVLYRLFGLPEGPCEPELTIEFHEDGSATAHVRNSDCSTGEFVQNPDGSGSGVTTFPDGTQEFQWWNVPVETATSLTVSFHSRFRDQAQLEMTEIIDNGGTELQPEDDTVMREGSFALPDGRALPFFYQRRTRTDHLRLEQEDGLVLTLDVPLDETEVAPDLSRKATGTVQADGVVALNFELQVVAPDAQAWDSWSFTTPQGEAGQFSLTETFVGSGQIRQAGGGPAVLTWNTEGAATLTLTDGSHLAASPSRAALDFIVDQWLRRFGEYGPAPRSLRRASWLRWSPFHR